MNQQGITVRLDDPTPVYAQVHREVLRLIAVGELTEGDRLPPLRQLARDLGVAPGTVARAYRDLEAAGTVTTRRGAGTRIAAGAPKDGAAGSVDPLAANVATLIADAVAAGIPLDEVQRRIAEAWPAG
ncbi:GntR family transcriptional regulator [Corynebacterium sp. TAE3-ERU16]|uniref:GntR family transcriptional regulator n=1 Tax=Corynebacterium sp. TAE3-ERU16 TaxID=2849493 RepID=UPI001C43A22C|nr:GntR family transcriptional regulator [Corynebacterium sp. TAE3-ERU16]MBV7294106.1 GntR family transcriptional regulator [Corynebacterium sp. TAE3-ERU16]